MLQFYSEKKLKLTIRTRFDIVRNYFFLVRNYFFLARNISQPHHQFPLKLCFLMSALGSSYLELVVGGFFSVNGAGALFGETVKGAICFA